MTLLSERRVGRQTERTYELTAHNRGTRAISVVAYASVPSATLEVQLGDVEQDTSVSHEFVMTGTSRHPLSKRDFDWRFTFLNIPFPGRFVSAPETKVIDQLFTYVADAPIDVTTVDLRRRVVRTDLQLDVSPELTVGALQPLIDASNGVIIAMYSSPGRVIIRMPDPGTMEAFELVEKQFKLITGIRKVRRNLMTTQL